MLVGYRSSGNAGTIDGAGGFGCGEAARSVSLLSARDDQGMRRDAENSNSNTWVSKPVPRVSCKEGS